MPGAAVNLREIATKVTQIVVDTTSASGAYVELIDPQTAGADVEVIAALGESVPSVGTRTPYPGSLTEQILESGEPLVMIETGAIGASVARYLRDLCRDCSALVILLHSGVQTIGALVLLRGPEQEHFRREDSALADALGEMVSDAFRRVSTVEELRQSEERFRQLAENGHEVFWITTPDFTEMLYISPSFEDVWGHSRESLYEDPRSWLDSVWPEDRGRVEGGLMRHLRGEEFDEEYRIVRPDGEVRWVWARAIPLRRASGEIHRIVGVADDITARKQAEAERERLLERERKSREQVTTILESITDSFFALDPEWRFTYVNREAERLLQRRREDLLGKNIWEEYPDGVGSTFDHEYHRAVAEQRTVEFEEKYPPRDIWVDVRAYASEEGLSVYLRDITKRRRAEEDRARLLESEREARADAEAAERRAAFLAEASSILASSLDYERTLARVARLTVPALADYCVIDVLGEGGELQRVGGFHTNPEMVNLIHVLKRFAPFRHESPAFKVLQTGQPELLPEVDDAWMQSIAETPDHLEIMRALGPRSIIVGPLRARDRTLGVIWLVWSESGRRYGVNDVALAEELGRRAGIAIENARLHRESEEARAEAERRREELQQVTESRATLMRGFTHDVKNPLGAADGLLQLLEEGLMDPLTPKQKESVVRARRSIGTALDLTQDLLELARAEAGEIDIERAPTNVREIATEAAEEQRPQAEAKGLEMSIEAPGEVPSIESDSNRVRQILGNLLSNAVKYTARGRIRVRVQPREGGRAPGSGRWIAVDITDTGPGIPEDKQPFLFQEFRRLDTAGEERGIGIGLAISLRIARALGGDLTVESHVGAGSTFTLWLPMPAYVSTTT